MTCGRSFPCVLLVAALAVSASIPAKAQTQQPRGGRLTQPVYRVAEQPSEPARVAKNTVPAKTEIESPAVGHPQQHPLEPAVQMAKNAMIAIGNNVQDYSCTLIKRERIGGKLNEREYMYLKVRHEPFSVYMYFLGPNRLRGQEVIYVDGQNNGNLLGHGVGIRKIAGTVPLQPTGAMAMQGQRYPITEIGMKNLITRLLEVAEHDKQFGECEVKFFRNAKITMGKETRTVTCIQVVHPIPRKNFRFHLARVYVDDELNLPVRYESYDWPRKPGGAPELLEEYTYTDIKMNNGFTDYDFNIENPQYNFR